MARTENINDYDPDYEVETIDSEWDWPIPISHLVSGAEIDRLFEIGYDDNDD